MTTATKPEVGRRYRVTYRNRDESKTFTGRLTAVLPRRSDDLLTFATKNGPRMVPTSFLVGEIVEVRS